MATYTVQDTTMTALGDAVRKQKFGITDIVENYTFTYPAGSSSKVIYTQWKNYKIRFNTVSFGETDHHNPHLVLYTANQDWISINSNDAPAEYQLLNETNVSMSLYNGGEGATVNFTIIPTDENGNEIDQYFSPSEMTDEINNLITIPENALLISGNCEQRFARDAWTWFIEKCGNKIQTKDITTMNNMFQSCSSLKEILFDINITSAVSNIGAFSYCDNLQKLPYVIGPERTNYPTSQYSNNISLMYLFNGCARLREIPYDWFWKVVPNQDWWEARSKVDSNNDGIFGGCASLRELPDISMLGQGGTNPSYSHSLQNLYSINSINNIPVGTMTLTSNKISSRFGYYCLRANNLTFQTNSDGTPQTANWTNQTMELNYYLGYVPSRDENQILSYNSGITADKKVYDDATYQALKNDPDWYSLDINYSRYNHDSAVNTINSLPDTSAYLASNGGTNTIKFMGQSGALTDGGAINTLTEEEIAVATSRGWTVSLV